MGLFWWEWYRFIDSCKMCRSYGGKRGRDMEGCRFIDMVVLRIGGVLVMR